jgi:hypothetical protein
MPNSRTLTPAQIRMQKRKAAWTRWANTADRRAGTAAATAAMLRKFEDQVDPDRLLDPKEREKRAAIARKAYFADLALKSSIVRAERKANTRRRAAS